MPVSSLSRCCWVKNGVEERKSIGTLSAFEQHSLDAMLDTLKKDIQLGEDFINK